MKENYVDEKLDELIMNIKCKFNNYNIYKYTWEQIKNSHLYKELLGNLPKDIVDDWHKKADAVLYTRNYFAKILMNPVNREMITDELISIEFEEYIKQNNAKQALAKYFSNVDTMINATLDQNKTEKDESAEKIEHDKMVNFSERYIANHIKKSFVIENNLVKTITLERENTENAIYKHTYVFSDKKTSNPLNDGQLIALYSMHHKSISNIQGPPGTGKTTLLKDAVVSMLLNKAKVVLLSSNNEAVDNIFRIFKNDPIMKMIPMIR